MVQVVENWSEIVGRVEEVASSGGDDLLLTVQVVSVAPVHGYPSLLEGVVGRSIRIGLSLEESSRRPVVGDTLRCLVRRAGPDRYFARADSWTVVPVAGP